MRQPKGLVTPKKSLNLQARQRYSILWTKATVETGNEQETDVINLPLSS